MLLKALCPDPLTQVKLFSIGINSIWTPFGLFCFFSSFLSFCSLRHPITEKLFQFVLPVRVCHRRLGVPQQPLFTIAFSSIDQPSSTIPRFFFCFLFLIEIPLFLSYHLFTFINFIFLVIPISYYSSVKSSSCPSREFSSQQATTLYIDVS